MKQGTIYCPRCARPAPVMEEIPLPRRRTTYWAVCTECRLDFTVRIGPLEGLYESTVD